MKVPVEYRCADWSEYYAFLFTQPLHRKAIMKGFLKYAAGYSAAGTLVSYLLNQSLWYNVAAFFALTVLQFALFYFARQQHFRQWAMRSWQSSPVRQRGFAVAADGLHIQDPDVTALFAWPKIEQIIRSHGHIFLSLGTDGKDGYYQIPDRSFPDQKAANAFFEAAMAFKEGRQPTGSWWTQGQSVTDDNPQSLVSSSRNQ